VPEQRHSERRGLGEMELDGILKQVEKEDEFGGEDVKTRDFDGSNISDSSENNRTILCPDYSSSK